MRRGQRVDIGPLSEATRFLWSLRETLCQRSWGGFRIETGGTGRGSRVGFGGSQRVRPGWEENKEQWEPSRGGAPMSDPEDR